MRSKNGRFWPKIGKGKEIKTLKREISILTDAKNQYQQNHSDLTLKHTLLEEKLVNLQRKHKTLEDKNYQILQQLTHMKEKINTDQNNHHSLNSMDEEKQSNETTPTGSDEQEHVYQIPTSNKFESLLTSNANLNEDPIPASTPSKSYQKQELSQPQTQNCAEKSTNLPQKPNTNKKPNHSPNTQTPDEPNNEKRKNSAETVILCDSNGRYLKPNILCPGSTTSYIRCPTLEKAKNIIKNTTFSSPKTFIIHCGTNDIENPEMTNEKMINTYNEITTTLKSRHPSSKVILSSLLPRADSLNERIMEINKTLEHNIKIKDINVVKHRNISKTTDLKDKKHLNPKGVKMFAHNLKSAYFGNTPSNRNHHTTNSSRPYKNTWINNSNTWNKHMDYPTLTPFNPNFPPTTQNHRTMHGSKMTDNGNPIPPQLIELINHLHRYVSN